MINSTLNSKIPATHYVITRGNVSHLIFSRSNARFGQPVGLAHPPAMRQRILNWLISALLVMMVAALVNVLVINALFFPDCNRITNDCFLIQKLWGAE